MLSKIFRWKPGQLARNSSVLFGWMLLRAGAQAATVVLLARILGAESYGAFVASIAVAGFIMPLVGLGLSHIVLRNGARDPEHLSYYFGRALRVWWITLVPAITLAYLLAHYLLPSGLPMVAVMSAMVAELAATSITELKARQQQAMQRITAYGAINAGLPLARLVLLCFMCLVFGVHTLVEILWTYSLANFIYISLLFLNIYKTKESACNKVGSGEKIKFFEGTPFSFTALSIRLQGEFNKPILARADFNFAGSYNIAQRIIEIASLPLMAMQEALWPKLYAHDNPASQLKKTGFVLVIISVLLGGLAWAFSPVALWIVGHEYKDVVSIIRMLAWVPTLQLVRGLICFQVNYLKHTNLIGWSSGVGAILGVAGVLIFVPKYGVAAAALVTYLSEIMMILFLLFSLNIRLRK